MTLAYGYQYRPAAHLLATGEDAAEFLQSQFSNDLKPFESGRCTYGLWLDVKGKVIADSFVLCEGDEQFRILSYHSSETVIAEKLERHIIADDVEIECLAQGPAIALVGNGAEAVLRSLEMQIPGVGAFTKMEGLRVYSGRRSLEPSFELWAVSGETTERLREQLTQTGVDFISRRQIERMRLAAGIPSIPQELGPSDLPGEGALVNDCVSLTKGCYLGQEVVSRMYNVGRAQRALFLMSGSGEMPQNSVVLYNDNDRQVGELRSAVQTDGGWQGVALLKTRYAEVGDLLTYDSGSVEILSLFRFDQNKDG